MEDYRLEQSGQEVQDILDGAAMQTDLTAENERAERAEGVLQGNIDDEALARQNADGVLQGKIDDEETRAKAAEKQNADDIDAIEEKIPNQASSSNQLADKEYVEDLVSTASATFRGTFNLVSDLHLTIDASRSDIATALGNAIATADNNDYAFVLIPTSVDTPNEIASIEKYKFNGSVWGFEYVLNNSGFTAAQWAAINSGITSALVTKLGALPTAAELATALLAKQDKLTFDSAPTPSSDNPVTSGGVYTAIDNEKGARQNADQQLQQAIEAILALIPSAATALNQLADKAFVNSSITTATATFRGTYNLVSDLHLALDASHSDIAAALLNAISTADNNDYAFVQIPTSVDTPTEIRVTERYKFNGTAWVYEYDLNNSGFTATQWEAINSGITALLVTKLGALPTAAELATSLAGKQNVLTFDNVPVSGSDNPVKSGGLYQSFTAIDAKFPSDASANNKLVAENRLAAYVTAVIEALDASFDLTSADGHVTFKITQTNGVIASVQILTSDIASASALTTIGGQVSTNASDIAALQALYNALQQSAPQIIQPSDTWPVANPSTTVIYRVIDRVNTPPQYYSDYMWNGTTMVLMATYNNAIDSKPTTASNNLVKSGGIADEFTKQMENVYSTFDPESGTPLNRQDVIFYSIDRSKKKPSKINGIRCKHDTGTTTFWKVTRNVDGTASFVKIIDVTWDSAGIDIVFVDVELGENDYIGVTGTSYYYPSGYPSSYGFAGVVVSTGETGIFSEHQALGFEYMKYIHDINAEKINNNTNNILENKENIKLLSQEEVEERINQLLDDQNLEHFDWDLYSLGPVVNEAVYFNLSRHQGGVITDIYYKTKGGQTDICLVTVNDNNTVLSIELLQENTLEVKDTPYIGHCHLSDPVTLGNNKYIGIRRNIYYGGVNDKSYANANVGESLDPVENNEICYVSIDNTLQGKSIIKDEAISLLSPSDFIKYQGHILDNGQTLDYAEYRNTGYVDVSSYYRIVANFQTQGIGSTYGSAILLFDSHFNLVKTYSADSYTRNCLFDIYLSNNIKYMIINDYRNVNGSDYTTYTCFAYKRIKVEKFQNILYRKTFNTDVVDSNYVNASAENFTTNGLLVNSQTAIRLNKMYSLQTKTLRVLCKFNTGTVAVIADNTGYGEVKVDVANKTLSLKITKTNMYTGQPTVDPIVKDLDFLSVDHEYLIEIVRDYNKTSVSITDINSSDSDKIEHTEHGMGGSGSGFVANGETAGAWHDYYLFSVESGSYLVKELIVTPLYGKIKTLLYGDSITELLYFPIEDYDKCWVQLFRSACVDRIMNSPFGGTSISYVLARIVNELPYINTEYVMVTIGTNGEVTFENLCTLVEYIFKCGATPVLNHIPCNESDTQITVNALIDQVREKYDIHGVDFDIPTSLNLDGQSVDISKMWEEQTSGGNIYHHPNVKGSIAMMEQIKLDMPELLI